MKTLLLAFKDGMLSAQQVAEVNELVPNANILISEDREKIAAILDEIEVAAGWLPYQLLITAPNLRWMQQWWAGADWVLRYPEAQRDFVLTNVKGIHVTQIGEHIFGLLLAFSRRLHDAVRAQSQGKWERPPGELLFELGGKTMLLIGTGAIGQHSAKLANAFGMKVIGLRRDPSKEVAHVEKLVGPDDLLAVLPEADFVVITAPLTPETRGMMGAEALQQMKESAYLINLGRGEIVDHVSLLQALQEGWIAGAGLDVFEEEPLPKESPLWQMENVIITAHYDGASEHYYERAFAIFIDNLRRYQAGEPLRNVVNKALGY